MDLQMRSITSKHKENRKRKRNQTVVGLILIFVMFSSVLGFAFSSFSSHSGRIGINNQNNINSVNYNGFEFLEQNGFWILNKNDVNFIFRYNPNQVDRILSEVKPLNNYQGKILYIYSEDILAESEVYTNLLQFTEDIENACLEECEEGFAVKTCEDNFVIIREGNKGIIQEDNCVFKEREKENLIKLTDEFLFK